MFKRMCNWCLNSVAIFALLTVTMTIPAAMGGDFVTSIEVRQEYNDNIFFADDGNISDFITTISPQVAFEEKNERLDAAITAHLDTLIYLENDQLNGIDQSYTGHWRIRVTPRFSFGIEGGYQIDTRSDRDVQETGIVLGTDRRTQQRLAATADYSLSEKAAVNVGVNYREDKFQDQSNSDYKTYAANILWMYNLSTYWPRTIGRAQFGHTRTEYVSTQVQNYSIMLGLSWQMTELLTIIADGGMRYTLSTFDTVAIENEQWGAVGQIELVYQGEVNRFSLVLSHDVTAASGLSGSTERTGLSAYYRQRLSERMWANLSGTYYLNKSKQREFATNAIDNETYNLRARLRYAFTEDVALESGYTFSYNHDNETGLDRTRNSIYLQIFLQYTHLSD